MKTHTPIPPVHLMNLKDTYICPLWKLVSTTGGKKVNCDFISHNNKILTLFLLILTKIVIIVRYEVGIKRDKFKLPYSFIYLVYSMAETIKQNCQIETQNCKRKKKKVRIVR